MNKKPSFFLALMLVASLLVSCNDAWEEHYGEKAPSTTASVVVYHGSVADYLRGEPSLSAMVGAYSSHGLMEKMERGTYCTAIVCDDSHIGTADREAMGHALFAANALSATAVSPSSLVQDYGVYTLSGKNLWVTEGADGTVLLGKRKVLRVVKADNGYVYHVDGIIPVQPSVYEYIRSLGDDHSFFKALIAEFEETYFDADSSTPNGVDAMGNTTYADSVMAVRNTLMDRYTEDGLSSWNMQSEAYQSTLFIPSDEQLLTAYHTALDSIPAWLNRAATPEDSLKFRKWMVGSFFVDHRLQPEEVSADVEELLECVGGCIRQMDEATDRETFTAYEASLWKPSVQIADAAHPVELSNGTAYAVSSYRIPNHVVIWRVKSRLYQVWAALDAHQQGWDATTAQPTEGGYFRWNHWERPLVVNDAQTAFELSATLPTMYYHVLTAIPDAAAQSEGLPVSVDYDGLLYNSDDPRNYGLKEVSLPAGEYYLRMGFKHSLTYSISIYFCGADEEFGDENRLVKDMSLIATGSNFHFDRGGAIEGLDFYGSESIGYPEYFDCRWWYNQDPVQFQKAPAYDTDGYQVAVVTLKKPGNFKIRIESNDNAALYHAAYPDVDPTEASNRTKNNVNQLMMYHWCLRPTRNNY